MITAVGNSIHMNFCRNLVTACPEKTQIAEFAADKCVEELTKSYDEVDPKYEVQDTNGDKP